MDKTFKIEESLYLTPHETYFNKDNYPDFQSQFIEFKSKLVKESKNSINSTYYKFGDGDYYILSKQSVGTSKPGLRDIKKSVDYLLNQFRTSVVIDRKSWILSLEKIQKQIEIWETGGESYE